MRMDLSVGGTQQRLCSTEHAVPLRGVGEGAGMGSFC